MKYDALFVIFEKKRQNLKLSSAANYRLTSFYSTLTLVNIFRDDISRQYFQMYRNVDFCSWISTCTEHLQRQYPFE